MKLYLLITLFFATTLFSQTKFDEMKKEYDNYLKIEKQDSALVIAKRMNKWALRIEKDTSLNYAVSFRYIGNSYSSLKLKDSAIINYNLLLKNLETQNRKSHKEYSQGLRYLGNIYTNSRDYETAKPYYKEALEIRKKVLGEMHQDYAQSLTDLGVLYFFVGDYKSAETNYKKALEIRKKVLGELHSDYAQNLTYLGNLYSNLGDYKTAEPYYEEALEIRKKVLGELHPNFAQCLNNLGVLYDRMGEYKLAETYYKKALEIRKKVLGEKHSDYASSLTNLGALYIDMGDYKSAEYYLKLGLDVRKKTIGTEHLDYAASLNFLGLLYKDLGNYNSSLLSLKESLEIRKKVLGENNKDYAISLNNVGGIYKLMGDFKSAEIYYKQSLSIIAKVQGEDHPNYATSIHNLGRLYFLSGDYLLAEKYLNQTLEIRKIKLGILHPYYANILDDLGSLYELKGDFKIAETFFNQALEIRKKVLSIQHPNYLTNLNHLALIYSKTNRIKDAFVLYENIAEIFNKNISSNFEWLNDKEKELFWNKSKNFYNTIDQFATSNCKEFPQIAIISYNANLFTKGKLLEAKICKENDLAEIVELREKLTFLRKKLAKIEDSDDLIKYKKNEDEANFLDSKLTKLWDEYATQKKNLSITWNQVQENLSNDEAAIEFVRYKAEKDSLYHYNALIIRKTDANPILVKLCTEKQLQKINHKEGFSSYYPLVWAPLEEHLENIKTIYYSPIGLLNTIPFSALYSKKGEGEVATFDKISKQKITTSEPKANFLMNRYTLHQLTSTRYLAIGLKEKALEKVESSINLVGGVNYDYLPGGKIEINKGTEYASRGANSINPLKYLEGTKTEVEIINKTLKLNGWETSLLEHNDATEENIEKLENQNAKGVLHIATHGFAFEDARGTSSTIDHASIKYNLSYNPDPMKRCGLIFAGGNWAWIGSDEFTKRNPDAEDGILTGAQVALLNLKKTKLVVLSACETGLGKIEGGEGVFGLKRAFKLAGVEQIIVSLWEVPDQETMQLMTLFYEDLAKTQNAIVSFEKAQKEMCKRYPTQPDLWAGFVLVR